MAKYVDTIKFCFEIPSDCWTNCKNTWGWYILSHPEIWITKQKCEVIDGKQLPKAL